MRNLKVANLKYQFLKLALANLNVSEHMLITVEAKPWVNLFLNHGNKFRLVCSCH